MDAAPAYTTEKTYGAFLHRELSVSWLVLATLMGGRHRLDPDQALTQLSQFGKEFASGRLPVLHRLGLGA
ncbi:MAG: hypothetical protein FJ082_10855 [Cyanobacteria bacterium K_Offshore_surface_m2_011]|nr:hypothetical protein [Cyanobacteria bacterium K_Offshore_surface_m2_011]